MLEIKRIKGYLSEHTDYSVRDYVCVRTAIKVRAACRFSVYGSPVDGVFFSSNSQILRRSPISI